MKFTHKILLLPVLTALAFTLIAVLMVRANREGEQTIGHIQDELFHALELSHGLQVDAMSIRHLMTNAVTAGNTDDAEEAARLAERVGNSMADCSGVPLLSERLATLRTTFDEYWSLARVTTADLLERDASQDLDFGNDLLQRVVLMNQRYEELNAELAEVVAASNAALDEAIADSRANITTTRRRMNIISIVFVTVLVLMSLAAIGSIVRPVERMGRVAQAIAGGDLHQELEFRSGDALGELADSFRDMQSALIADIARRERAEADLITAQGQIIQSEKMAALGKMVAGLAHEMNTPLGAVASSADTVDRARRIVADRVEPGDDARLDRALTALGRGVSSLNEGAARIDELVAGLRAFSQLDRSAYRQTDVNTGVAATLTVLEHEVPVGLTVTTALQEIPPILGYPAQLNQMLLALLRHAIRDAAPPGRITLATRPADSGVEITVHDEGGDHDPATLRSLFAPGFRATTSRVRMDWGLLACAGIAENHGGTITAEASGDEGTVYRVWLPLQAPRHTS